MTSKLFRGIASVVAVSALTVALVGCDPSPTSTSPGLQDVPQDATDTGDQAGTSQADSLDSYVAQAQAAIPQIMEQNPGLYSEISIEAIAPDTVHFAYVYADQVDTEGAQELFDGYIPTLQTLSDTQIFPEMATAGVTPTQKVKYTYYNSDGSEIWTHTFEPSSE